MAHLYLPSDLGHSVSFQIGLSTSHLSNSYRGEVMTSFTGLEISRQDKSNTSGSLNWCTETINC